MTDEKYKLWVRHPWEDCQKCLGTFPTVDLAHQQVAVVKRAYEDLGYDNFKETEFVIRFYGAEPKAAGKAA